MKNHLVQRSAASKMFWKMRSILENSRFSPSLITQAKGGSSQKWKKSSPFVDEALPYKMSMGPPSSVPADDLPSDETLSALWTKLVEVLEASGEINLATT